MRNRVCDQPDRRKPPPHPSAPSIGPPFRMWGMNARTGIHAMALLAVLAFGTSTRNTSQTAVCSNTPREGEGIAGADPSTSSTAISLFPEGSDIDTTGLAAVDCAVHREVRRGKGESCRQPVRAHRPCVRIPTGLRAAAMRCVRAAWDSSGPGDRGTHPGAVPGASERRGPAGVAGETGQGCRSVWGVPPPIGTRAVRLASDPVVFILGVVKENLS